MSLGWSAMAVAAMVAGAGILAVLLSTASSGSSSQEQAVREALAFYADERSAVTGGVEAGDLRADGDCVGVEVRLPGEESFQVAFLRQRGESFERVDLGPFALADIDGRAVDCHR